MFLWLVLGIIISLVLPILSAQVKQIFAPAIGPAISMTSLWQQAKPFIVTSLFAILTAVVILASIVKSGGSISSWADALLYGFAWDSILQKLLAG